MQQYFAYDYDGGAFELFGTGHLVYLAILAALVAYLIWGWPAPDSSFLQMRSSANILYWYQKFWTDQANPHCLDLSSLDMERCLLWVYPAV